MSSPRDIIGQLKGRAPERLTTGDWVELLSYAEALERQKAALWRKDAEWLRDGVIIRYADGGKCEVSLSQFGYWQEGQPVPMHFFRPIVCNAGTGAVFQPGGETTTSQLARLREFRFKERQAWNGQLVYEEVVPSVEQD